MTPAEMLAARARSQRKRARYAHANGDHALASEYERAARISDAQAKMITESPAMT